MRLCCLSALLVAASVTNAADWPQYRGAKQDGKTKEKATAIAKTLKFAWTRSVGDGHGTPSIKGDRVFVVGSEGKTAEVDVVRCLELTSGKTVWSKKYGRPENRGRVATRRAASHAAPTVEGDRVWTISGDAQLMCWSAGEGKLMWKRELLKEDGAQPAQYGHNASPVIFKNLVIVPARLRDASIVALDKRNGKEIWRAFHKTRRGGLGGFWSTPVLTEIEQQTTLVYLSGLAVVGINPQTGRSRWKFDFATAGFDLAERGAIASSPVIVGNRVYFSFHPDHRRGFSGCLKIEQGNAKLIWKRLEVAPWWNEFVAHNGSIYVIDQGPAMKGNPAGKLYCLDLATGKIRWSTAYLGEKKSRANQVRGGRFFLADGKLVLLNGDGYLMLADVSPKGAKPIASHKVIRRAGKNWTTPVLANGFLFCRDGRGNLSCYDVR